MKTIHVPTEWNVLRPLNEVLRERKLMTDKPFDWSKPFTTRDGRLAKRVFSGINKKQSELVVVSSGLDSWTEHLYSPEGVFLQDGGYSLWDLINTPTKRTVYLVIDPGAIGSFIGFVYSDEASAREKNGQLQRFIPVEIEEP